MDAHARLWNRLERLWDFEQDVLRSMEGAKIFCRVRSYLSTCRNQGLTATQALTLLFQGKNPEFMEEDKAQRG